WNPQESENLTPNGSWFFDYELGKAIRMKPGETIPQAINRNNRNKARGIKNTNKGLRSFPENQKPSNSFKGQNNETSQKKLSGKWGKLNNKDREFQKLLQNLELLKRKLSPEEAYSAQKQVKSLEEKNEKLTQQLSVDSESEDQQLTSLREELKNLQKEMEEKDKQDKQIESERDRLAELLESERDGLAKLSREKEEVDERLAELSREKEEVDENLSLAKQNENNLNDVVNNLKLKNQRLKQKLSRVQVENENFMRAVDNVTEILKRGLDECE
ncbi:MAG: hypothetical protein LBH37_03185, partial [Oscillospiraceae bacterium]|nr:hypothetical protein [Oscillospiraceae bacterium]